jgi:hypothetical protein
MLLLASEGILILVYNKLMKNTVVDETVDFISNAAFYGIIVSYCSIGFLLSNGLWSQNKPIQSLEIYLLFTGSVVVLNKAKAQEIKMTNTRSSSKKIIYRINGAGRRID